MNRTHLREGFGQKILLEPGGEAKFLVEPVHMEMQRFVAAIEKIDLLSQRI
jgi:hypothetical protein